MGIRELITFRVSGTGIWSYEFYDEARQKIGSVSSLVSPAVPVRIESQKIHWYSRFDIDTTIIPGIGRRVQDNQTGKEVFRLIYWRPGLYQVRTNSDSVQVEIKEGRYLFGQQGMPATALSERISDIGWQPASALEYEAYFKTTFYEEVNEAFALMVLSFPALRFY